MHGKLASFLKAARCVRAYWKDHKRCSPVPTASVAPMRVMTLYADGQWIHAVCEQSKKISRVLDKFDAGEVKDGAHSGTRCIPAGLKPNLYVSRSVFLSYSKWMWLVLSCHGRAWREVSLASRTGHIQQGRRRISRVRVVQEGSCRTLMVLFVATKAGLVKSDKVMI